MCFRINGLLDVGVTLPDKYMLCNDYFGDIVVYEQSILDAICFIPVNKGMVPDCISRKMLNQR